MQTPTLTILTEREDAIKKFVPRDYWEVHGEFAASNGKYNGAGLTRNLQKTKLMGSKRRRLWDQKEAEAIRIKCQGKTGAVNEESKPATEICPLLYDLTSLQRDANGRFGFSAKMTLGLAQALYEKHKVLTYPRTDSRALLKITLGLSWRP